MEHFVKYRLAVKRLGLPRARSQAEYDFPSTIVLALSRVIKEGSMTEVRAFLFMAQRELAIMVSPTGIVAHDFVIDLTYSLSYVAIPE